MNPCKAGDKAIVNDFRKKSLRELKKIEEAWPGLNYGLARYVLIVETSAPSMFRFPGSFSRLLADALLEAGTPLGAALSERPVS